MARRRPVERLGDAGPGAGAFGETVLSDLAGYVGGEPRRVASQLASVPPDLVDAMSVAGTLIPADELAHELNEAVANSDSMVGPFGPHVH